MKATVLCPVCQAKSVKPEKQNQNNQKFTTEWYKGLNLLQLRIKMHLVVTERTILGR